AADLLESGTDLIVIEDSPEKVAGAVRKGVETVRGNAVDAGVLEKADIDQAAQLIIAIPEGYEAGAIFQRSRSLNSDIKVIARAH
ncbi:NAD-binding protein, partial [Sphingomonas sp.]|uniref:NAD-binding protein n=2 Tax=Sphingomonadaceae TaxID=41297 RepID=UPI003F71A631